MPLFGGGSSTPAPDGPDPDEIICPSCNGSAECSSCDGRAYLPRNCTSCGGKGCSDCYGAGQFYDVPCTACRGWGGACPTCKGAGRLN
jgi:DnaJ-class molecular chaperone